MDGAITDWRTGYIERTRIARKASGMRAKAIAAALGMSVCEYKVYEKTQPLPFSFLDGFTTLTRVSKDYMMNGVRHEVRAAQITQTFNEIAVPKNRCGGPCPYSTGWCQLACINADVAALSL